MPERVHKNLQAPKGSISTTVPVLTLLSSNLTSQKSRTPPTHFCLRSGSLLGIQALDWAGKEVPVEEELKMSMNQNTASVQPGVATLSVVRK